MWCIVFKDRMVPEKNLRTKQVEETDDSDTKKQPVIQVEMMPPAVREEATTDHLNENEHDRWVREENRRMQREQIAQRKIYQSMKARDSKEAALTTLGSIPTATDGGAGIGGDLHKTPDSPRSYGSPPSGGNSPRTPSAAPRSGGTHALPRGGASTGSHDVNSRGSAHRPPPRPAGARRVVSDRFGDDDVAFGARGRMVGADRNPLFNSPGRDNASHHGPETVGYGSLHGSGHAGHSSRQSPVRSPPSSHSRGAPGYPNISPAVGDRHGRHSDRPSDPRSRSSSRESVSSVDRDGGMFTNSRGNTPQRPRGVDDTSASRPPPIRSRSLSRERGDDHHVGQSPRGHYSGRPVVGGTSPGGGTKGYGADALTRTPSDVGRGRTSPGQSPSQPPSRSGSRDAAPRSVDTKPFGNGYGADALTRTPSDIGRGRTGPGRTSSQPPSRSGSRDSARGGSAPKAYGADSLTPRDRPGSRSSSVERRAGGDSPRGPGAHRR